MSKELDRLRRTRNIATFIDMRNQFDSNYFTKYNQVLPKWYQFLYHNRPDLVCTCYRNKYVLRRFLLQGSGYSETSNSGYKRNIVDPRVRISKVPEVMDNLTREMIMKRTQYGTTSAMITNKLKSSGTHRNHSTAAYLITNVTTFSIQKFLTISVPFSSHFVITNIEQTNFGLVTWPKHNINAERLTTPASECVAIFTFSHRHDTVETPSSPFQVFF